MQLHNYITAQWEETEMENGFVQVGTDQSITSYDVLSFLNVE
jgi:hypothetical protein